MKKNILYLTYDGLTDPLGQSQILPYVYSLNKNQDFKFTIISFEKKENNYLIDNLKALTKDNGIHWIPLRYTKKPLIISTIIDLFKLNATIVKLIKNKSIDLIHSRSYIVSLIALRLKKSKNIPFIFDMRGFYADERLDGKVWPVNQIIFKYVYKYFKFKERNFLQLSSHIISLTSSGKKEIQSWNLPYLSPISIIPCCTDEDCFNLDNIKPKRKQLGIKKNDFIISYVGSIGTWYMLDQMLDFFKALVKVKSNSKFLFITKDSPNQIYEKCSKKNISKSSIIVQESSRELMPSYIGISNFSIFFILPYYSKKASSPTKMGEIMNLGIPIICNSGIGDVDNVMNECMPELLVNEFNDQEYERVINLILTNYKVKSTRIVQTAKKYYSLTKGVQKYADIYREILK